MIFIYYTRIRSVLFSGCVAVFVVWRFLCVGGSVSGRAGIAAGNCFFSGGGDRGGWAGWLN